jgi:hypothetical protein
MPPWRGAARSEHERGLSIQEVDTIEQWVREGAVAGDPKDAPPPAYEDEARARQAALGIHEVVVTEIRMRPRGEIAQEVSDFAQPAGCAKRKK